MNKLILIIICSFIASCEKQSPNQMEETLSKFINDDTEICVVIPREGCGGCISDAAYFLKNNFYKYKGLKIIFTGVVDQKELMNITGKEVFDKGYAKIDTLNLLNSSNLASIYPQTYIFKRKKLINTEKFDYRSRYFARR